MEIRNQERRKFVKHVFFDLAVFVLFCLFLIINFQCLMILPVHNSQSIYEEEFDYNVHLVEILIFECCKQNDWRKNFFFHHVTLELMMISIINQIVKIRVAMFIVSYRIVHSLKLKSIFVSHDRKLSFLSCSFRIYL